MDLLSFFRCIYTYIFPINYIYIYIYRYTIYWHIFSFVTVYFHCLYFLYICCIYSLYTRHLLYICSTYNLFIAGRWSPTPTPPAKKLYSFIPLYTLGPVHPYPLGGRGCQGGLYHMYIKKIIWEQGWIRIDIVTEWLGMVKQWLNIVTKWLGMVELRLGMAKQWLDIVPSGSNRAFLRSMTGAGIWFTGWNIFREPLKNLDFPKGYEKGYMMGNSWRFPKIGVPRNHPFSKDSNHYTLL